MSVYQGSNETIVFMAILCPVYVEVIIDRPNPFATFLTGILNIISFMSSAFHSTYTQLHDVTPHDVSFRVRYQHLPPSMAVLECAK